MPRSGAFSQRLRKLKIQDMMSRPVPQDEFPVTDITSGSTEQETDDQAGNDKRLNIIRRKLNFATSKTSVITVRLKNVV